MSGLPHTVVVPDRDRRASHPPAVAPIIKEACGEYRADSKTMKETGADMKVKYKETARGGLTVNVIEC